MKTKKLLEKEIEKLKSKGATELTGEEKALADKLFDKYSNRWTMMAIAMVDILLRGAKGNIEAFIKEIMAMIGTAFAQGYKEGVKDGQTKDLSSN